MDQKAIQQRLNTLEKLKSKLLAEIEAEQQELKELQSTKIITPPKQQRKNIETAKKKSKKPIEQKKPVKKVYTEIGRAHV